MIQKELVKHISRSWKTVGERHLTFIEKEADKKHHIYNLLHFGIHKQHYLYKIKKTFSSNLNGLLVHSNHILYIYIYKSDEFLFFLICSLYFLLNAEQNDRKTWVGWSSHLNVSGNSCTLSEWVITLHVTRKNLLHAPKPLQAETAWPPPPP